MSQEKMVAKKMCWKVSHSDEAVGDFYTPWRHLEIKFFPERIQRIEDLLRQLHVEYT